MPLLHRALRPTPHPSQLSWADRPLRYRKYRRLKTSPLSEPGSQPVSAVTTFDSSCMYDGLPNRLVVEHPELCSALSLFFSRAWVLVGEGNRKDKRMPVAPGRAKGLSMEIQHWVLGWVDLIV